MTCQLARPRGVYPIKNIGRRLPNTNDRGAFSVRQGRFYHYFGLEKGRSLRILHVFRIKNAPGRLPLGGRLLSFFTELATVCRQ